MHKGIQIFSKKQHARLFLWSVMHQKWNEKKREKKICKPPHLQDRKASIIVTKPCIRRRGWAHFAFELRRI